MTPRVWLTSGELIARLPATRPLLAVMPSLSCGLLPGDPVQLGAALSDPYLSYARPLRPACGGPQHRGKGELERVLHNQRTTVGAVVLVPPLCAEPADGGCSGTTGPGGGAGATATELQKVMMENVLSDGRSRGLELLPWGYWSQPLTVAGALEMANGNLLWDDVGLLEHVMNLRGGGAPGRSTEPIGPCVQAAVGLQHLLDVEAGGWANTFG
jgi:hypothetical protein